MRNSSKVVLAFGVASLLIVVAVLAVIALA